MRRWWERKRGAEGRHLEDNIGKRTIDDGHLYGGAGGANNLVHAVGDSGFGRQQIS